MANLKDFKKYFAAMEVQGDISDWDDFFGESDPGIKPVL